MEKSYFHTLDLKSSNEHSVLDLVFSWQARTKVTVALGSFSASMLLCFYSLKPCILIA